MPTFTAVHGSSAVVDDQLGSPLYINPTVRGAVVGVKAPVPTPHEGTVLVSVPSVNTGIAKGITVQLVTSTPEVPHSRITRVRIYIGEKLEFEQSGTWFSDFKLPIPISPVFIASTDVGFLVALDVAFKSPDNYLTLRSVGIDFH